MGDLGNNTHNIQPHNTCSLACNAPRIVNTNKHINAIHISKFLRKPLCASTQYIILELKDMKTIVARKRKILLPVKHNIIPIKECDIRTL